MSLTILHLFFVDDCHNFFLHVFTEDCTRDLTGFLLATHTHTHTHKPTKPVTTSPKRGTEHRTFTVETSASSLAAQAKANAELTSTCVTFTSRTAVCHPSTNDPVKLSLENTPIFFPLLLSLMTPANVWNCSASFSPYIIIREKWIDTNCDSEETCESEFVILHGSLWIWCGAKV